jgi:hypothetical protein
MVAAVYKEKLERIPVVSTRHLVQPLLEEIGCIGSLSFNVAFN